MGNIYVISGPCGCGKSTLTDAYAEYLVKVEKQIRIYVIHGDMFHQGFVGMYEQDAFLVELQESNPLAWTQVLKFNWECILDVARKALRRGLDVVIDYVVEDELPLLQKLAKEQDAKLYYLVLTATEEAITERLQTRGDDELIERAIFLKKKLDSLPENQGHLYDNAGKTVEEEVAELSKDMEEFLM
ncbi:MAG: AAA family ATPase [Lachnospiraceae bacterium]|nr:AAA family ATPase [Lachnospiraceae bacterium]